MPAWSGSTPIVWGDRIFLNVAENGSLFLWAVDRTKGEPIWKRHLSDGDHRQRKQNMSTPSPVTDGTQRLGDDRHRHPEGVRLHRQRALDARHPEGLRAVRPPVGLRIVAAAVRRLAVRAGAARHEDRRSVVRPAHQQGERPHDLARGAADDRAARVAGLVHDAGDRAHRATRSSSSSPAATP